MNSTITISRPLEIDGGDSGIKISGDNKARILLVSANIAPVRLSNLTLQQGRPLTGGGNGAALFIFLGSSVTVSQTTILTNTASTSSSSSGGGIFNQGQLKVIDSTFRDNRANGFGGAIANTGVLEVSNSTFRDNRANNLGGAIYNAGVLEVSNSVFYNNSASFGGGIANFAVVNISQTNFISNTGGLANMFLSSIAKPRRASITASMFMSNTQTLGGGIYNELPLTISDTTFRGNRAVIGSGDSGMGGALYNFTTSSVTMTNALLQNNTAVKQGGAINNQGTIIMLGSQLVANRAPFGGGVSNALGRIDIRESTIEQNQANNGGGIYNSVFNGTITITKSLLRNNRAFFFGGGLENRFRMIIDQSTITNNQSIGAGGGLVNLNYLDLSNTTIYSNTSNSDGGAIANTGIANVVQSTLSDNRALRNGGGLSNYPTGKVSILQSTISNNTALKQGGAITNTGTITVGNSIIAANIAITGTDFLQFSGSLTSLGYNLIGSNETVTNTFPLTNTNHDLVGTAANPLDPQLGPLQDNGGPTWTMKPLPNSPAIDTGTASSPFMDDQRGIGFPRKVGTKVDIGAVEVQFSEIWRVYLPLIVK